MHRIVALVGVVTLVTAHPSWAQKGADMAKERATVEQTIPSPVPPPHGWRGCRRPQARPRPRQGTRAKHASRANRGRRVNTASRRKRVSRSQRPLRSSQPLRTT